MSELPTDEVIDGILGSFNGGLIDVDDADNPRGYRTTYQPRLAMRVALKPLLDRLQAHYDEMCTTWGKDSGEAGSAFVALEIAKKGEYQ